MSARVTRKRARLDSATDDGCDTQQSIAKGSDDPQDNSASARTRDEEFWYDDGTIILVAGNVEFRVYKGILAENSSVFRDMFSLPQPPILAESSDAPSPGDGCPIVHLSDSPEDLRHILRVYTPRTHPSPFEAPKDPSFAAIAAAARLGHKYQMTRLLEQALTYLKTYYTNDYEAWQKEERWNPPGFRDEEAIGVVNLARFLGETSLLPAALLACCQLGRNLINGFAREDGTREQLTLDDIGLCLEAKPRLVQETTRSVLHVFEPGASVKCLTAGKCRGGFRRLLKMVEDRLAEVVGTNPFYGLFNRLGAAADVELCQYCRAMAKSRDSGMKQAVWARLPEILGIPRPGPSVEAADGEAAGAA
ncbi:uncharacterized protein TRAVEDRAFT_128370 [Trametes versicolor FP-101664 SS1]|uniref:uncharacterized protein n=1 Tax=Trametes versicolor (strain FP-101664) TaxID=717944 RepID=UPI0004622998|nr:uncharacterized protein TRAVEDRAFT_128370 [Trametes versicolor FP-101664 SS1]EIW56917.1 hypothetical protein TRAVEDRAFT_128370 [Trametes versicolor FP-101664 SS1]